MTQPNLSLTCKQVKNLLESDGFGTMKFARAVCTPVDAFSFAVHQGLIGLNNPPTCTCGNLKILERRPDMTQNDNQGLEWRCPTANCPKRSITSGTWFGS